MVFDNVWQEKNNLLPSNLSENQALALFYYVLFYFVAERNNLPIDFSLPK